MVITAKLNYLRISPRKVRLVTDLIKGLPIEVAERQLKFLNKRAAKPILKLLNSAVANAKNNAKLDKEGLYIAKIIVEGGPMLKRWLPRAMGRAAPIMKRTSHITLVLEQGRGVAVPFVSEAREGQKETKKTKARVEPADKEKKVLPELEEKTRIREEKKVEARPKRVLPLRPYPTTSQAKKRFFSRQTFGNIKKFFRRKSI